MKRFWTVMGIGALVTSFALCDVALAGRRRGFTREFDSVN